MLKSRTVMGFAAVFLLLLSGLNEPVGATLTETLPTYHWSYDVLDQLRIRGYFTDLFVSRRPYTRGVVARELISLRNDINAERISPSRYETGFLNQLFEEFKDELAEVEDLTETNYLKLGFMGNFGLVGRSRELETPGVIHYGVVNAGTSFREGLRSRVSVAIHRNITLYHTLRFDRNLKDDPTYIGKKFAGFNGFIEQAYVRGDKGRFEFKIGRDFLELGPGKSGNVLISDNSRPFDQYRVGFRIGPVALMAFGIQLDDVALDSVVVRGRGPVNTARRYLNGHRADIRIGHWANIGISELVLYGGPYRHFELAYINPVNFYHGVTLNDEDALGRPANTFGSIDFDVFPSDNIEIYGELLIDDVKLEKANASDLEPNRIAYILGVQYANPIHLDGVTLRSEYTRVANRTYNVLFNQWEKYLHRNRPVGHFLGSNFDRIELSGRGWVGQELAIAAGYERLRQGSDNIASAYNTDYLSSSLAQGYSEPFPFGPVQSTHAINLSADYLFSVDLRIQAQLRVARVQNFAFTGRSTTQVQLFRLGVMVNYDRIFGW